MTIESPLFQSSMELLGHSITHFNGASELDRKLVILHLSNAIELLLKDMVLDAGQSIYKNPKETISINGCIDALKVMQIDIPFINKIELLIDERNALQHRFGSPNELTAIFYMNIAQQFFCEVLKQKYSLEFDKAIIEFIDAKDLEVFRLRYPINDSELKKLKNLVHLHPLGALLSATAYMEKILYAFTLKVSDGEKSLYGLLYKIKISPENFEEIGIKFPSSLENKISEIRYLRNMAAHGREEPAKKYVMKAISTVEEFEDFLSKVDIVEVRKRALQNRMARQHVEIVGPFIMANNDN